MAEGIVINMAEKVLASFGSAAFQEVAACWGARADANSLRETIEMIKAVLLDAQRQQDSSEAIRQWLCRLRDVLYEADDLFDEILAVDGLKDLMDGNRLLNDVKTFFSKSNMLLFNRKMAQGVKVITEKLDRIKLDMEPFKFQVHQYHQEVDDRQQQGINGSRRGTIETGSFVVSEDIIGREDDKEKILELLLDYKNVDEPWPDVVPILGFGGLGKTALAQLVYNDEIVGAHFELKAWACISDTMDTKEKAKLILQALYVSQVSKALLDGDTKKDVDKQSLDEIQLQIQRLLSNKIYLLVLDDVWDEDYSRWIELRALLRGGKSGSKIILTTRLMAVADNMGTFEPHQIEGLAPEKALTLFEALAFKPGQKESNPCFVRIARAILDKCKNVPLAIKSVASLLRTKDTISQWESVSRSELLTLELKRDTKILPILKLSYDHLPPHLKQCFAFCALYHKDFRYHMVDVAGWWIAQGFITPNGGQNLLEAAMECYMELIKRSFFQDITWHTDGYIYYSKMHDLVHDLALYVAGSDSFVAAVSTKQEDYPSNGIRHVAFHSCIDVSWNVPPSLLASKHLRTVIKREWGPSGMPIRRQTLEKIFSSFKYLRMLEMTSMDVDTLPSSVGQLKHLRYVLLHSWRNITYLPKSFSRLYNLQTLAMGYWTSLKAFPRDFTKLVNLVSFNITDCHSLTHMPPGFGQLTKLERLSHFYVGKSSSILEEGSGLDALDTLTKLRMPLRVEFREWCTNPGTANLTGLLSLEMLIFQWKAGAFPRDARSDEIEFRCSHPPNLKKLVIDEFPGSRLPNWGMDKYPSPLPFLVSIRISNCRRCNHLPPFSRLPSLEELVLMEMRELEYIERDNEEAGAEESKTIFFPVLRQLKLSKLPKLKAWSPTLEALLRPYRYRHQTQPTEQPMLPCFPRLSKLRVQECPLLESLPLIPHLQHLVIDEVKDKLKHQLQMRNAFSS